MEAMLASALAEASIQFTAPHNLDFHLPDHDVFIEVKQFHSDRIAEQMSRAPNVIAVQGRAAVEWLCEQIRKGRP